MKATMALLWAAAYLLPPAVSSAQIVEYYSLDATGNVRVVTDQQGKVIERHDYLPFGEECTTGPCVNNPGFGAGQQRKFTGKERDAETGLDYFGARHYGSKIARFTTVDPAYTIADDLVDPQRWNKYAYARNNPLRYVDPDGREITYATAQLQTFFSFLSARSGAVRATLALYAGPNNPNLMINQEALGKDVVDGSLAGNFSPSFDFTTDIPSGSGNFDRLGGMSQAELQAGLENGSLYTSATLKSATLTLDSSLGLSMTNIGRSKQEQQTIGVALHELGHADSAARDPLGHFQRSLPINQMEKGKRQEHDKRQVERDANKYRDQARRDFPQ